jgi:broad specificity phosphatase PhoE
VAVHVVLVCHGSTAATRTAAFPLDEPLEAYALRRTGPLKERLPAGHSVSTSPELRCRQTAEELGLIPNIQAAPADWNLGNWAGQTLDDLVVRSPEDLQTWRSDPDAAPHGGETLSDLISRVGAWLDGTDRTGGVKSTDGEPHERLSRLLVITHSAVIRAALVYALGAGTASFWRIDAGPLSVAQIRGRRGRWAHHLRD